MDVQAGEGNAYGEWRYQSQNLNNFKKIKYHFIGFVAK